MDAQLDEHYVPIGDGFVLHPRHFVLGATLEYIRMPLDCAAYVVGRSTWGRRGLVIATAVGIHPGYAGNLVLELTNLGEIPLRLYPGCTIAQMFVHRFEPGESSIGDRSMFVGGTLPEPGVLRTTDRVLQRIQQLAEQRRRAAQS
jgi:dCTP deaminase